MLKLPLGFALFCCLALTTSCAAREENLRLEQIRQLHHEARAAYEGEDFFAAALAYRTIEKLAPGNPMVQFNLARVLALAGETEEAIAALDQAIGYGFDMWRLVMEDQALEPMRGDPRAVALVETMKDGSEKRAADKADPYAAAVAAPCPLSASARQIARFFDDKREAFRQEGFLLGPWPTHETDWSYIRGKIDALCTYIADNPNASDVPRAYVFIVKSYMDLHKPVGFSGFVAPRTAERMADVVNEFAMRHPNSRLLREARYLLLNAQYEAAVTELLRSGSKEQNLWDQLRETFSAQYLAFADEVRNDKFQALALSRAIHFGYANDKPAVRAELAKRILRALRGDRQIRAEVWRHARVPLLNAIGTPNFRGEDISGQRRSLQDYRGQLLILHFWSTWCGPCRRELPEMIKLHSAYREHGVHILGVALEFGDHMGKDEFIAWCRERNIEWPQLYSDKGFAHPVAKQFRIQSIPRLIFIDREGRVAGEGRAHAALHWICDELDLPLPEECQAHMAEEQR